MEALERMPEDWERLLAIVAHPDDLEYGAASAVARWTDAARWVGYVVVTDGEAGIDGMHPAEAGPLRRQEEIDSAAIVGVHDVTFLGHPDGVVEAGLGLRRALAREIRRHRPDVLLVANFELTFVMRPGQDLLNQADHRVVGVAGLDAARDAGNRWLFPELLAEGLEPWPGVQAAYVMGDPAPTHAVDVTDTLDRGVRSLQAHRAYLDGLGREFDPEQFLRRMTAEAGAAIGVDHAVALRRILLQGV